MMRIATCLSLFVLALLTGCSDTVGAQSDANPTTKPKTDPPPAVEETPEPETDVVYVRIDTSLGDIDVELNKTKAPISVANFLQYTDDKFYDGTVFHRVMSHFMIQGGGFTPDLKKKTTRNGIANEWKNGLKNDRGTIAMARVGGRVNSGTSQFFINVVNNDGDGGPDLNRPQPDGAAYAVFGKVVAGMDVVDKIRVVPVGSHPSGMQNVPLDPVIIETVRRITKDEVRTETNSDED